MFRTFNHDEVLICIKAVHYSDLIYTYKVIWKSIPKVNRSIKKYAFVDP